MSRIEMMREKRSSISVELIKLLKSIDCFDGMIICVFEGEDAKYYGSRIDSIFTDLERRNISCKGKGNVIGLKEKVDNNAELIKANIIFFIDTDFDDRILDYNLYSTPCYAVENFYVSNEVFKKVLTDELGLCSFLDSELIKVLSEQYSEFEVSSDIALLELNAWIKTRLEEYKTNKQIKLNLNNASVEVFLRFNGFAVDKIYSLHDLDLLFSIETPLNEKVYENIFESISREKISDVCRGKYRLEYFRSLLSDLFNMSRNGTDYFNDRKIKPKLSLVKANIISELSQYAQTPTCLNDFLNEYKSIRGL